MADQWWHRWATANVGISTGPSGLVVADLDVKATIRPPMVLPEHLGLGQLPGDNGPELFGQVARRLSGADRVTTRTIRTPSGGYHCWFRTDVQYRSSKGTYKGGRVLGLGWSIDVRSSGGYVVAAGSTTRDGSYTVVRDLPILPVPAWLAEWLTSTGHREGTPGVDQRPRPITRTSPTAASSATRSERYAMAALRGECDQIAAMESGSGRNDALNRTAYKLGGYVADGTLDEQTVVTALTEAGLACGLGEREATKTIRSGLTAGMRKPRVMGGAA